jgi:hypothetical protein
MHQKNSCQLYKYIQIQKIRYKKIVNQETHMIKFVKKMKRINFGENIVKRKYSA